jgi:hypothetical protein
MGRGTGFHTHQTGRLAFEKILNPIATDLPP